jgi:aspartyl protease family protein
MDNDTFGRLAYLVLLLLAVGGWVIVEYRGRMGAAMRTAAAWGLIFVGVAAGYGLWTDIQTRIAPMQQVTPGAVEMPRAEDGHYYATLTINGKDVQFLADTGATNMVLSRNDAERVGVDMEGLRFIGQAMTANGMVRTARITLPQVDFGPFADRDVVAYVTDGEMEGSLLGMDYLGTFKLQIEGGKMVLSRN